MVSLSSLISKNQSGLLDAWNRELLANPTKGLGRISDAELKKQTKLIAATDRRPRSNPMRTFRVQRGCERASSSMRPRDRACCRGSIRPKPPHSYFH